jgi:hypothetical protein
MATMPTPARSQVAHSPTDPSTPPPIFLNSVCRPLMPVPLDMSQTVPRKESNPASVTMKDGTPM